MHHTAIKNRYISDQFGALPKNPVAYFSAEFGLHESLAIYSGGLGILAGDHIKSASDLGLSFTGIGLFYDQGYFLQSIDKQGDQSDFYQQADFSLHTPQAEIELQTAGSTLKAAVIRIQV